MVLNKRRNLFKNALFVGQSLQKRERRLHALHVMPERTYALTHGIIAGALRLAEIMTQNGKPYDEILVDIRTIVARGCKGVKAATRMVPHITLRMPLRRLKAADKSRKFRKVTNPSCLFEEIEPL